MDLKLQIKSLQKMLINKLRNFTKNLKAFVNKSEKLGSKLATTSRVCSRCGETKPLDKDHYQVVKAFSSEFSYYCNNCSIEMRKTSTQKSNVQV